MNLNAIDKFIRKNQVYIGLLSSFLVVVFSFFNFGVFEALGKIEEIRTSTATLAKNLKGNTAGGISVIVGVNPKETKENLVFVYENNELNLKPGDVIFLKNYTDNTFQSTLRFIVQKSLPVGDKNSIASIFISDEAARKISFEDYKKRGTINLKMLRSAD